MTLQITDSPFAQSAIFRGKKIHLGISGSVSCYKAADLLRAWLKIGIEVSATLSPGAAHFITPMLVRALGASPVYDEMFSGDIFAHLEPGQKADCMAIVPASADIMAKMANGIADEMLCAQYVAFGKSCAVAPAMNPAMWANPATQANAGRLGSRGCAIIEPDLGGTACGDEGKGRLAPLPEIFLVCLKMLAPADMSGMNVIVTLGPTREPWDGARFWSNPSSGKMGAALATAAWLRGASVTAICGPASHIYLPRGMQCIKVHTANEMFEAASDVWPAMDIGIFNAAVADFAPVRPKGEGNIKFKKETASEGMSIAFSRNPDILATLGSSRKPGQKIMGFAAEVTESMEALFPLAKAKLKAKNADMIAANRVNNCAGAFGSDHMDMAVVDSTGAEELLAPQGKADLAWCLLSWLLKM